MINILEKINIDNCIYIGNRTYIHKDIKEYNVNNFYYILYEIINHNNDKRYRGKHVTANILDEYFGSGNLINKAYKKYSKLTFSKLIIGFYNNEDELLEAEKYYVPIEYTKLDWTYNQIPGGSGNKVGEIIPDEQLKQQISESLKKYYKKNGANNVGRIYITDIIENKCYRVDKEFGENLIFQDSNRFKKGRLTISGINHHSLKMEKAKWINKNEKNFKCPLSQLDKYLSKGWIEGKFYKDSSIMATTKGKIVINKNEQNKNIFPEELDKYLLEGWVKGKYMKIKYIPWNKKKEDKNV